VGECLQKGQESGAYSVNESKVGLQFRNAGPLLCEPRRIRGALEFIKGANPVLRLALDFAAQVAAMGSNLPNVRESSGAMRQRDLPVPVLLAYAQPLLCVGDSLPATRVSPM
jgi:hypothetical protein